MRVEHVETGLVLREMELKDAALGLALGDEVDGLQGRGQGRALIEVFKEISMQMKRIYRIELDHIDKVDANRFVSKDLDGFFFA